MFLKIVQLCRPFFVITLWPYVMWHSKTFYQKSANWNFNSDLILAKGFKEVFKFFWCRFENQIYDFSSLSQWWDNEKVQIKLLCQQNTLNVTHHTCRSIKHMEREIVELEALALRDPEQIHTVLPSLLVRVWGKHWTWGTFPKKFTAGISWQQCAAWSPSPAGGTNSMQGQRAPGIDRLSVEFY